VLRAAHPKELPLEVLVRLLKQSEDDSSCHTAEAHPEVLPKVFSFEKMKEDVYGGWMAEVIAKDGEGPTVGVQLGGSNIHLSY